MEINELKKVYPILSCFNIEKAIGISSINYNAEFEYKKNIGFVYFLCDNNEIVYIGCSEKKQRIGAHQNNKIFNEVFYFICKDLFHLKIESILIDEIYTKYNNCTIAKKMKKRTSKNLLYKAIIDDEIFNDNEFNKINESDLSILCKYLITCGIGKQDEFKEKFIKEIC